MSRSRDGHGLNSYEIAHVEEWAGKPLDVLLEHPGLLVKHLYEHIQEQVRNRVPFWDWKTLDNALMKLEDYCENLGL
jgi:hypothetical protein